MGSLSRVAVTPEAADLLRRLRPQHGPLKFHVGNVMQKLGARRRAEAVYAASKLGLI